MRFKLIALLALLIAAPAIARENLTQYVDPFIGSDGTGHTSPAASRPFAMVAPGPDNADTGWEYTSGYQYRAPTIMGFSQTRASGTGIPELGDILLQPIQRLREGDFASRYDKSGEVARAGYYAVSLTDNDVRVELTSTGRVALHRYTFTSPGRVWMSGMSRPGLPSGSVPLSARTGAPATVALTSCIPSGRRSGRALSAEHAV